MCFRGECPFSGNSFNFRLLCIFCKGSSYLKFLPFSPLHFVLLLFCSINNENQNLGEKPWLNYINLAKSKSGVTVYWTFSWDNYRNSHKSKSLLHYSHAHYQFQILTDIGFIEMHIWEKIFCYPVYGVIRLLKCPISPCKQNLK